MNLKNKIQKKIFEKNLKLDVTDPEDKTLSNIEIIVKDIIMDIVYDNVLQNVEDSVNNVGDIEDNLDYIITNKTSSNTLKREVLKSFNSI